MARLFTAASSNQILLGPSSVNMTFGTIAAIVRKASDPATAQRVFQYDLGGLPQYGLRVAGTNELGLAISGGGVVNAPTITVTAAMGWVFCAISKPSGTVNIRYHKYVYSTGVWSHENSAGTQADSTTATHDTIRIGAANGALYWDGDIAVAGGFGRDMTDQQIEALAFSLMAWYSMSPASALWVLHQASTSMLVNDLSGHGANQTSITGTSVSTGSVPVFSYGFDVLEASARGPETLLLTLSATLTPTAALVKRDNKALAGTLTPSGAVTPLKVKTATFSATLTPTAALVKQTAKSLAGTLTPAAALVRMKGAVFSATLTPAGALRRMMGRVISAVLSPAGALTTSGGFPPRRIAYIEALAKSKITALTFTETDPVVPDPTSIGSFEVVVFPTDVP